MSVITSYVDSRIADLHAEHARLSSLVLLKQQTRDELNEDVRQLRQELVQLAKSQSDVGTVVKVMERQRAVVTLNNERKIVSLAPEIDPSELVANSRVIIDDGGVISKVLASKVDPLVSLMKVEKVPDSTYDLVGGCADQIRELREVIELPIKHPELFDTLGISQPKGVLLYGPPGTGKTLLARAVAHHTDCTFIRVSGGELVQKYIGEGSRMVRELFVMARQHAPSIIFLDEIDSIGGKRTSSTGGESEVQRTMLELLNQLDGFEQNSNIKVIMATNRIDILDPALLRPGRIDRKVEFPNPDLAGRLQILKIHSQRMNLRRDVDLDAISRTMEGTSGAELKSVCQEAGFAALRERRVFVTQDDFVLAASKLMARKHLKDEAEARLFR